MSLTKQWTYYHHMGPKIIVQDEYEGFIVTQMQKYIKGDVVNVHGLGDNVTMRKVGDISFFSHYIIIHK